MRTLLVLLALVYSNLLLANQETPIPMGFSEMDQKLMTEANAWQKRWSLMEPRVADGPSTTGERSLLETTDVRAFAEYEDTGYLIFSSMTHYNSEEAKLAMARNLPDGTDLVVYTGTQSMSSADVLKKKYSAVIDADRVHVVYMPRGGKGFWARDGVPVPVLRQNQSSLDEFLTLVDARYYHGFEADQNFAELFQADLTKHQYYFEGGNFIANSKNDCLVVNTNATQQVPDQVFEQHYGCQRLVRLKFVKGIGHADESVKFVDDNTVLTDEPSYVEVLERYGFDVVMLPRPRRPYETYVNSLFINGVAYVPVFGQSKDEKALQVYRDMGFQKVIGLNSVELSNNGMGSLHCITMTYPKVPLNKLLQSMGGHLLK